MGYPGGKDVYIPAFKEPEFVPDGFRGVVQQSYVPEYNVVENEIIDWDGRWLGVYYYRLSGSEPEYAADIARYALENCPIGRAVFSRGRSYAVNKYVSVTLVKKSHRMLHDPFIRASANEPRTTGDAGLRVSEEAVTSVVVGPSGGVPDERRSE